MLMVIMLLLSSFWMYTMEENVNFQKPTIVTMQPEAKVINIVTAENMWAVWQEYYNASSNEQDKFTLKNNAYNLIRSDVLTNYGHFKWNNSCSFILEDGSYQEIFERRLKNYLNSYNELATPAKDALRNNLIADSIINNRIQEKKREDCALCAVGSCFACSMGLCFLGLGLCPHP